MRWETNPDDIHGLIQAQGVITSHGGMTTHAAVVARGHGQAGGLRGLDPGHRRAARVLRVDGHSVNEGDWITIDGTTGRVMRGPSRW